MKKKNPFSQMQNAAVGMAGLGITTGVVAGVDKMLPPGTPGMSQSMNTLTSFAPIGATIVGGKTVLGMLPKSKKKW